MYCVKCGVELHDQEERCPLCGTPVWRPDAVVSDSQPADDLSGKPAEKLYSDRIARSSIRVNRVKYTRTTGFVIIVVAFLCALVNLCISGNFAWSKYALISLALLWTIMVVPIKYADRPVGRIALVLVLAISAYLLVLDWFIGFTWWAVFASAGLVLLWVYGGLPFTQQYYYRQRMSVHLTFCILMTGIVLLVFDLITGKTGFSLYTSFGLACLWCYIFLPMLLRTRYKVYPVIVADFLITLVTCWMFLDANKVSGIVITFALSTVTLLFASGFLVVTIAKLTKFSIFGTVGIAFAFTALFLILLSLLINRCIFGALHLDLYAIISASCLVPLSAFLILLEKSHKLKDYLSKKLFI